MDTSIIILIAVLVIAAIIGILFLAATKGNEPPEECIWSDRKRTFLGLPWSFTKYFLTSKKLITRKGLFNLKEDEIELYKVVDKNLDLPFLQRIVNCGTIHLMVKDIDTPTKDIICIKNARDVMKQLEKNIEEQKEIYNVKRTEVITPYNHFENND